MSKARKRILQALGIAVAAAALAAALVPRPVEVDVGTASRSPMTVTADGQGQTRVRDRYAVAAPVPGRLRRIAARAGDPVRRGDPVAAIDPADPVPLDNRTRLEAEARLAAARAVEAEAQAAVDAARIAQAQARRDLERFQALERTGSVPARDLETARSETEARDKAVRQALLAVDTARRQAQAASAALLAGGTGTGSSGTVVVPAPADGVVLRVLQESEGPVAAGTPLLEVGDPASLEVVVDLLTPLAVQVPSGARVSVVRWGGAGALPAHVRLVEPSGFTKVSALGVEEQRVYVRIDPDRDAPGAEGWASLGDGYRIEAEIVLWESADATTVPEGALFRHGDGWAAFRVADGRARRVPVQVGHRNGRIAEVVAGLSAGDPVVLFPGDRVTDGIRVAAAP